MSMPRRPDADQLPLALSLSPRMSFDDFVPGPNLEALNRLQHIAAGVDSSAVYLFGPPGTGKSHLLQAACVHAAEVGGRAQYLPLAGHGELHPGMVEGLEAMDLVCIDDIDAVAGMPDWEQALLHLYNRIRDRRQPLVMAGTASPGTSALGLADLRSRLGWGVVYQLRALDDEGKLLAVQRRAAAQGFELPREVAEFMLRHCARDLVSLLAVLRRLDTASLAAQRRLTIPFVKGMLKGTAGG